MKTIEIITHCYSVKYPDYAKALTVQLSSLVKWQPKCNVRVIVFTSEDDVATHKAVAGIMRLGGWMQAAIWNLPLEELFRRSVGRDRAMKATTADIVWLADCDYFFGEGCFDTLAATDFKGLGYPRRTMIQATHALGDAFLDSVQLGELTIPDLKQFVSRRERFPTGGIMLVDGETANLGYRNVPRCSKPTDIERGFLSPTEDVAYRKCFSRLERLQIPNIYRLRHSESPYGTKEHRLRFTGSNE